jgi:hypothetical protein
MEELCIQFSTCFEYTAKTEQHQLCFHRLQWTSKWIQKFWNICHKPHYTWPLSNIFQSDNKSGSPVLRNEEGWSTIAYCLYQLWNLPNCVRATDKKKNIRIQKLPGSGSTNFNYKSYHSLVLMTCCNANGLFTTTRHNRDGGVFRASRLEQWLPAGKALPYATTINIFSHYFVADEAFSLKLYLICPYP